MTRILALDPGKTTGFCYGLVSNETLYVAPGEEELSLGGMVDVLKEFIEGGASGKLGGTHIVYEDFTHRQGATGVNYSPVKLQGIIELYKELYEPLYAFFHKQNPSVQAKGNYYSDSRLKELGVYYGHGKGHARSATKHMLHWLNFGSGGQYVNIFEVKMELVMVEDILTIG